MVTLNQQQPRQQQLNHTGNGSNNTEIATRPHRQLFCYAGSSNSHANTDTATPATTQPHRHW